jgi:hypothetical protein
MSSVEDKILVLSKQLYPTGRAFKMPAGGDFEALNKSLAKILAETYQDAVSTLNSILPDNDFFLEDDAINLERFFGLISNPLVSLSDRKKAIIRKMNAPGVNPAKGNYLYVQSQLRAAGFDVYVHENIPTQDPGNVIIAVGYGMLGEYELGEVELGDTYSYYSALFDFIELGECELGEFELGEYFYKNKVVNHIDEQADILFSIGDFTSCFFIGGQVKGTFATVDINRKTEFRQLILKLKQTQLVAILFINYI